MNRVIERLSVANLKVNVNKFAFFKEKVVVLGFNVSKARKNPNPAKNKEFSDLQLPRDISGVKQILGMVNFYRKFIPNFASLAELIV